jgi:hypothetical protein
MARSWSATRFGVDPAVVRSVGTALVIATVATLIAAGLATVGWIVPTAWWRPLAVGVAIASTVTLTMFFHPWIVFGLVIDAVLIGATLVIGWSPTAASP